MSIKRYCDVCDREVSRSVTGQRLTNHDEPSRNYVNLGFKMNRAARAAIVFEVMCGINNVMNGGDLCRYCVLDAIASLDDRPREATP